MGNPTILAQILYDYAAGDAVKTTAIETARDSLITTGALSKGGMNSIISGTKNSVSYSMMVGMSVQEQLMALNLAVRCLSIGARPTTRTVSRF